MVIGPRSVWRLRLFVVQSKVTLVDRLMRRPPNSMRITPPPEPAQMPVEPESRSNYLDLYGLSKPPFGEGRDNAGYILFGSQRRAFELLTEHIVRGVGMVLLQGEEGIGKSETLRAAAAVAAESGQKAILISRPAAGSLSLAQLVSALNGQPSVGENETDRVVADFLAPPRKALLVDDIDLLPKECLQLLVAVARAMPEQSASPAMVLSYSTDLAAAPIGSEMAELTSLARNSIRLSRLMPAESHQFMERSLWVAGGTARRLIAPDALKLAIARSGGVPGIIDRHMEAVFTTGFARSESRITARTVAAAMGPIAPGRPKHQDDPAPSVSERAVQLTAGGLLAVGVAVFLYKGMDGPIPRPAPSPPQALAIPSPPAIIPAPAKAQPPKPADALSPELMAALLKRGDQSLGLGDITAARLLFQRAAEAGNAAAALSLGKTYDPNFIAQGSKPDPASAISWYLKAVVLGDPQAATLLKRLERR
jgi:type II secretory pathway predicted ATPase ExeA